MSTQSEPVPTAAQPNRRRLVNRRSVLVAAAIAGAGAISAVATGAPRASGTPSPETDATPKAASTPSVGSGTPTAAVAVAMRNYKFVPDTLRIAPGTTVTWTNYDFAPHSATARKGEFDSDTVGNGESFSHTFESAGSIPYYCRFHAGSMTGTVEVA